MAGEEERARSVERVQEEAAEIESLLTHPGENRAKRWLLLDGNRRVVAAALLAVVFGALVALGVVWPVEMHQLLAETTTVQALFNTLLSGTIVLVSVVVSINWIVLSQDLTPLGEQRERIENSLEFRRATEDSLGVTVSPAEPARFLRATLDAIRESAASLRDRVGDAGAPADLRDDVDAFVAALDDQARQVDETLADASPGSSSALLAGLDYDYSRHIYDARRLQNEHADALPDDTIAAVDSLVDGLTFYGTAREYFKTLFYMREFATLSRTLLFVSLPAIVFNSYVLLSINAQQFPEVSVLGISPLMAFVSAAYTVALAPFVVLTAYVLRPATVAIRTLATGPFVPTGGASDASDDT